MNAEQAWQAALGQLQMEMPRATFDTWVRDVDLLAYEDGSFILGVQNAYARDWLENRLLSTVKRVLIGIMGRTIEVRFAVWQGETAEEEAPRPVEQAEAPPERSAPRRPLIPRYTFDTFVVGPSNRLAHAAAQAVAENPARAYNPLFVYGGVGLGKTHLLHAVGNATAVTGLQVLYVTSEEFTNDLINAIRNHTTDAIAGSMCC
jgi:chromosomal replication initiator protein